jgi:RNA polymerase sporulation-specific sigma factor
MYKINDYEIIYLIKDHFHEDAFAFMLKKYEKFIWKNIHLLYVDEDNKYDFYQESIIMLHKAIQTFDECYNKTFTRYFELILKRRLYSLKKEVNHYVLKEPSFFYQLESPSTQKEDVVIQFDDERKQKVYELYFDSHRSIKYISETLQLTKKQVYNTIYLIKQKIKEEIS